MPETLSRVEFIASLAARGNAIQFGSDGGSLRLDVPKSDADALLLMQKYFRDVAFKITVEPCKTGPEQGYGKKRDKLSTRQVRKSEWTA